MDCSIRNERWALLAFVFWFSRFDKNEKEKKKKNYETAGLYVLVEVKTVVSCEYSFDVDCGLSTVDSVDDVRVFISFVSLSSIQFHIFMYT